MSKRLIGFTQADVPCPECGAAMRLLRNKTYRYENTGDFRLFYGCSRYPSCMGTHSAHPNGEPCGFPADKETKHMRILAHRAFNTRIQQLNMSKKDAYSWLARAMGKKLTDTHIAMFDKEDCEICISLCQRKETET